jgi:hypothetical protein
MAGHKSLHDIFRHELNLLATIARCFHVRDVLMDVAKHQGYKDFFEALQVTPEAPDNTEHPRRRERKS